MKIDDDYMHHGAALLIMVNRSDFPDILFGDESGLNY